MDTENIGLQVNSTSTNQTVDTYDTQLNTVENQAEQQATHTEQQQKAETQEQQKDTTQDAQKANDTTVPKAFKDMEDASNALKEDLAQRNVDLDAIEKEYFDNDGKLSDKTYEELSKAGYPKQVIDTMIKSWEITAQQFVDAVLKEAGGEEGLQRISTFLQSQGNAQINTFNKAIETGDMDLIKLAIKGVQAEMQAQYGTSNKTTIGNVQSTTQSNEGYSSLSEMQNAMRDPRYGRDRAYTQEVERKTMASNLIG